MITRSLDPGAGGSGWAVANSDGNSSFRLGACKVPSAWISPPAADRDLLRARTRITTGGYSRACWQQVVFGVWRVHHRNVGGGASRDPVAAADRGPGFSAREYLHNVALRWRIQHVIGWGCS
jgi:hypothetical protein